jgi:hypothetical protein
LPGGETGAVDAVVDGLVDRVYGRIDLVMQILGEETGVSGGELLELRSKSALQHFSQSGTCCHSLCRESICLIAIPR